MVELSTCNKTLTKIVYVKEKQKFMVRKETRTYNYDSINQTRLGKSPIKVIKEFLPLSVLGEKEPKKSVKIQILLKRSALNPETLTELFAYFTQTLEVKVLTDSMYKFQYVTVDNFRVWLHNLDSGQTVGLPLSGSQTGIEKNWLGTEKRITEAQALDLMEKGTPCFEKYQGEFRILV
jgi:hypothetical protein